MNPWAGGAALAPFKGRNILKMNKTGTIEQRKRGMRAFIGKNYIKNTLRATRLDRP
jgi:hypothetical protein